MKKKLISMVLVMSLLGTTVGVVPKAKQFVQADEASDEIVIAVEEGFGFLDIMAQTEYSNSADWIYRMLYDRLLEFDRDGNLMYSLATSITFSYYSDGSEPVDLVGTGYIGDYNPTSSSPVPLPPGWTSATDDIDWDLENALYFGDADGIILNIKLRDDVSFSNGIPFNISVFEDMINEVKTQTSSSSLIYKQWSPLAEIEGEGYVRYINDYEGEIRLCFTEDIPFGFIDFIYSLATPMASIVYIPEYSFSSGGIRTGSGAYQVSSLVVTDRITLTPNLNWYGEELVWSEDEDVVYQQCAEDITFIYQGEESARESMFLSEEADITMISANGYSTNNTFANMSEDEYQAQFLAGNPVMLTFNVNDSLVDDEGYVGEEETLVDILDIREYIFCILAQFEEGNVPYANWLTDKADGLWAYNLQKWSEGNNIIEIDLSDYPFILWSPNEKYHEIAYQVEWCLEQYGMQVVVEEESNVTAYDMKIDAVDVTDLNTVYNTLLGKVNTTIDNWLSLTRRAANGQTYISLHANIQEEFINQCTTRMNLGWENKVFLTQSCIHGFDLPQYEDDTVYEDFTPTGNISRVDFRWISKTVA